jgi:hypothetical protein
VTVDELPRAERRGLAAMVRRFPQVHLGIGLLGNALFITGTVLFIVKMESIGLWFFLTGSSGMFLGSLGELLRNVGRRKLREHDVDPWYPDHSWSARKDRKGR